MTGRRTGGTVTQDRTAAEVSEDAESVDASAATASERLSVRGEIERRASGQRLTPAQRRIAQCLIENDTQIGFLSSQELANLANVSQPSVTRFAMSLGFDGYLDMRRHLRAVASGSDSAPEATANRYQAAALAEALNLTELAQSLADQSVLDQFGQALAHSRPLAVLGLRASANLATQFHYFGSKVHPDIRLLAGGGSIVEDQLEQARAAGAQTVLAFMMPLYPRETIRALEFARQIGLKIALVADVTFNNPENLADLLLTARVNTSLVFDSYAASTLLVSVLLDAMCRYMEGEAQKRLDHLDRSSKKRRVFMG